MRILINLPIQRSEADAQGKTCVQNYYFQYYYYFFFSIINHYYHPFYSLFTDLLIFLSTQAPHACIEDLKLKLRRHSDALSCTLLVLDAFVHRLTARDLAWLLVMTMIIMIVNININIIMTMIVMIVITITNNTQIDRAERVSRLAADREFLVAWHSLPASPAAK